MADNVTPIDAIAAAELAAKEELQKEFDKAAMVKLKASLKRVADSERITQNLRLDHQALIADLRAGRL